MVIYIKLDGSNRKEGKKIKNNEKDWSQRVSQKMKMIFLGQSQCEIVFLEISSEPVF